MDQLGCRRYCCRRMIMTHVDLIEKLLRYVQETILPLFNLLCRSLVADITQLQFRRERPLQGSSISQPIFLIESTCHRPQPILFSEDLIQISNFLSMLESEPSDPLCPLCRSGTSTASWMCLQENTNQKNPLKLRHVRQTLILAELQI
jgi:hypothetical protein